MAESSNMTTTSPSIDSGILQNDFIYSQQADFEIDKIVSYLEQMTAFNLPMDMYADHFPAHTRASSLQQGEFSCDNIQARDTIMSTRFQTEHLNTCQAALVGHQSTRSFHPSGGCAQHSAWLQQDGSANSSPNYDHLSLPLSSPQMTYSAEALTTSDHFPDCPALSAHTVTQPDGGYVHSPPVISSTAIYRPGHGCAESAGRKDFLFSAWGSTPVVPRDVTTSSALTKATLHDHSQSPACTGPAVCTETLTARKRKEKTNVKVSGQKSDKSADRSVKGKPSVSYIELIGKAILSSPDKKMILQDIYRHIMATYPYYNNKDKTWRNSIRHNLSLNECFQKCGQTGNGKCHFWRIHPSCVEDFANGDFRRRRARYRAQHNRLITASYVGGTSQRYHCCNADTVSTELARGHGFDAWHMMGNNHSAAPFLGYDINVASMTPLNTARGVGIVNDAIGHPLENKTWSCGAGLAPRPSLSYQPMYTPVGVPPESSSPFPPQESPMYVPQQRRSRPLEARDQTCQFSWLASDNFGFDVPNPNTGMEYLSDAYRLDSESDISSNDLHPVVAPFNAPQLHCSTTPSLLSNEAQSFQDVTFYC